MALESTGTPSPFVIRRADPSGGIVSFGRAMPGRSRSPGPRPETTPQISTRVSARTSRFDRDLDALATGYNANAVEHLVQGQPVGDEVVDVNAAVGDHGQGALVVLGARAVGAPDHQLAVVDDVGVQGDHWVVLGQSAEEADPTPGRHHAQG